MHDLNYTNLLKLGVKIRQTIKQNSGIPVTDVLLLQNHWQWLRGLPKRKEEN